MRMTRVLVAASAFALLSLAAARAETKVELKNVHLCCGQCVKIVGNVLKKVKGVKGACDKDARTITLTADDEKAAQAAVDALAQAGFHGDTGSKEVTIKDDSGVKEGKVKSLTLTGIHNCCGACCKQIKETLKGVEGVKGDTAKPKATTFTVTGDFDAAAVIKALNDAGFHPKVKK
jgi:copper chaperone CopZ